MLRPPNFLLLEICGENWAAGSMGGRKLLGCGCFRRQVGRIMERAVNPLVRRWRWIYNSAVNKVVSHLRQLPAGMGENECWEL